MNYLETIYNLRNKRAVITGGSGILGSEIAKGLLNAGAKVALLGRNKEKLNEKVISLQKINNNVLGFNCDVLDEEGLIKINDQIISKHKSIDVLINAAGGHVPEAVLGSDQSIFDLKIENFKKVTDLNFYGTVLPTLVFGKSMSKQKRGSIINVSSMAAQRVISRAVGYSAAKAAVENFTRWLSVEMARKFGNEIRVNAIAPGFFLTHQNKDLLTNKDGTLTERGQTILNLTPFKRFGTPDELIGTILWLASDASKFVTGTIIPVDGGFSANSGV